MDANDNNEVNSCKLAFHCPIYVDI